MRRILLIEDSKEFQFIVKTVLNGLCHIDCAVTEDEVNRQLELAPDLILLDVMLPTMDGFQLCARLRNNEKARQIPIIFLTGKKETADKVMGFSLGAEDYIVKRNFELVSRQNLRRRVKLETAKNGYDEGI